MTCTRKIRYCVVWFVTCIVLCSISSVACLLLMIPNNIAHGETPLWCKIRDKNPPLECKRFHCHVMMKRSCGIFCNEYALQMIEANANGTYKEYSTDWTIVNNSIHLCYLNISYDFQQYVVIFLPAYSIMTSDDYALLLSIVGMSATGSFLMAYIVNIHIDGRMRRHESSNTNIKQNIADKPLGDPPSYDSVITMNNVSNK